MLPWEKTLPPSKLHTTPPEGNRPVLPASHARVRPARAPARAPASGPGPCPCPCPPPGNSFRIPPGNSCRFDRNCRRYLRKAEAIPHEIRQNEDLEGAYALIQSFIARSGYRSPMSREEWERITEKTDVFTLHYEGQIVACDVALFERPYRAHALLGAMGPCAVDSITDFENILFSEVKTGKAISKARW